MVYAAAPIFDVWIIRQAEKNYLNSNRMGVFMFQLLENQDEDWNIFAHHCTHSKQACSRLFFYHQQKEESGRERVDEFIK